MKITGKDSSGFCSYCRPAQGKGRTYEGDRVKKGNVVDCVSLSLGQGKCE